MRPRFTTFVAISLLGVLFCFSSEQAKKQKEQAPSIRVQVEMVSLPVVVTTQAGKRITDLEKQDFEVFEDGVLQEIAGFSPVEEPFSVALLLDTSGSTELRLAQIQNESINFVKLLHPDDSVAVLSFAQDVNLHEDFSLDRNRNARGIKETRPGGSTVLYEGVWLALEEVLKPIKERTALVLFTDGVDTASRTASMKETLELAKETRAVIYCIYFNTEGDSIRRSMQGPNIGGYPLPGPTIGGYPGPTTGGRYPPMGGGQTGNYSAGRSYLANLSEHSGGMVFDALVMDNLGVAFEQIAKELSSQYSIGYYSRNANRDGKFRKIVVKVKKPDLIARTKKGYYAPKSSGPAGKK